MGKTIAVPLQAGHLAFPSRFEQRSSGKLRRSLRTGRCALTATSPSWRTYQKSEPSSINPVAIDSTTTSTSVPRPGPIGQTHFVAASLPTRSVCNRTSRPTTWKSAIHQHVLTQFIRPRYHNGYRQLHSQANQKMEFPPSPPTTPPNSEPSTLDAQLRLDFLKKYSLNHAILRKIKDDLVDIAQTAGQIMIDAAPSVGASDTKNNTSDRVTATDRTIEKTIQDLLISLYPDFGFLGEETFKLGDKLTDRPTFVCDPIDGTLNFIHGFPNSAVSLALTIEKKPFIGVVYNPFRGDLFTAIKWQGAFLSTVTGPTRRLPSSPTTKPLSSLNDCLVVIEWGSQREGSNWELRTSIAQQLMTSKAAGGAMVHSIRSNGSAALDFCYVAAGWIDVFWEGGCWCWDVCAGWIILEEAGGIVASANPGDWDPTLEGRLFLAVRGAKHAEQEGVVKELWALMGERRFTY